MLSITLYMRGGIELVPLHSLQSNGSCLAVIVSLNVWLRCTFQFINNLIRKISFMRRLQSNVWRAAENITKHGDFLHNVGLVPAALKAPFFIYLPLKQNKSEFKSSLVHLATSE